MAEAPYTRRNRALSFAARAHRNQLRKGTDQHPDDLDELIGRGVPYFMHPAAVGMLLLEHGAENDVVIAGILHDVTEDTDVTEALLAQEFGIEVARLVADTSEPDKSFSWRERKEHTLEHLATATFEVKLIAAADKLHNVQSIQLDAATLGDKVWERFNATREDQGWYYEDVVKALSATGNEHPLIELLRTTVQKVFRS